METGGGVENGLKTEMRGKSRNDCETRNLGDF